MDVPNVLRMKCVVVGDSTVGKTALVQSFVSEGRDFPKNYNMWKEPDLFMVIYDVTSQSSLEGTDRWAKLVRSYIPTKAEAQGILFGNKIDLTERRVVTPKAGAAVAEKLDLLYFEGSALENEGVEEPFFLLAHEWHKLHSNQKIATVPIT